MSGPTLDEVLAMVTDMYEAMFIEAEPAVEILAEVTGWSMALCARMLGDEMTRRDRASTARDRAAEQATDDDWTLLREWRDDGSWS